MSLNLSRDSVSQKRTLESLLAGRVTKRPKVEDSQELQQAAIQLLYQHQNLSGLLSEVLSPSPSAETCVENAKQEQTVPEVLSSALAGSLLVPELKRQADRLGVPVVALSVRLLLERLKTTCHHDDDDDDDEAKVAKGVKRVLLPSCQRSPYKLEVAHHLNTHDILSIKYILESDEETRVWMVAGLKALCGRMPPQGEAQPEEEEQRDVQHTVLSSVVGLLVGTGYEETQGPVGPSRGTSLTCCSILDDMLSSERWIQLLDASLCSASASPEALRLFFMHTLTHTLTYKPRLKVSDAVAMQNEWSFAKTSRLHAVLFRKLAIVFRVEDLLHHLHQVLETQEVNWQHVLSFLSTLLVFTPDAQPCLRDLLGRLLTSAFEGYDLENMITAFLLTRQGCLEGPGFFPSYSEWFKLSFGGPSGYHGSSKKSLVFLLKFLSDLVPFDPPQYLKVHILHPPYVAVKHRSLLQEYVSLAKTRLADLKHQCHALQDVEKALSLFTTTGRISAPVMEASIFRRPYFLNRFLTALLTPRVLPLKADLKMSFIDALKKTDKIPAAQYSAYVEACQRQRQENKKGASCVQKDDGDPLDVLNTQLKELRRLVTTGEVGEMSAQLSRISHTLGVIFPDRASQVEEPRVIELHVDDVPLACELHVKVVDEILRTFCQCLLDSSSPPNKQSQWAAQLVDVLLGHTELVCVLMHRLWDLFHNQVTCSIPLTEALAAALLCNTQDNMLFCV
ncbi:hypothetical protein CRUP_007567, partial [Coryphaenoides rupestris]